MKHDSYVARFRDAEEKSRRWGTQLGPVFDAPMLDSGIAFASLPNIGRMLDSPSFAHFESGDIRLHCAEIHMSVFANRRLLPGPCVLTLGDVEVDGKREYGTTYPQLRQEVRGEHRFSEKAYPCHVWLTFADMHIVDVTFFVYRYFDQLPDRWRWSDFVLCSDSRHPRAATLPLEYIPMLVGQASVEALVDPETLESLRVR